MAPSPSPSLPHRPRPLPSTTTVRLLDRSASRDTVPCWARDVTLNDFSVVSGPTGIGAYVNWKFTIDLVQGASLVLIKRYSEIDDLREDLVQAFPQYAASIPPLPRKSTISKFRPEFLEERRDGLSYFIYWVLLHPLLSSSPIVKDFVFAK